MRSSSPKPFFTIITATIQRDLLFRACECLDRQAFTDWEHIIAVDQVVDRSEIRGKVLALENLLKRKIFCTGVKHGNDFGHTARHLAYPEATGNYLFYYDDDNRLLDNFALQRIHDALVSKGCPPVAFVPIQYLGHYFFPPDPPRLNLVDMGNIVVKREIGRFPLGETYGMDGVFAEQLARDYQCEYFADLDPVLALDEHLKGL